MVPDNNCQKIKLLKIMEMLQQDSDEQHPLSTSQICKRLAAMSISCDRRTLAKDIATLNKQGYEIMFGVSGHEKAYYVEDRSFSVPEIKILISRAFCLATILFPTSLTPFLCGSPTRRSSTSSQRTKSI